MFSQRHGGQGVPIPAILHPRRLLRRAVSPSPRLATVGPLAVHALTDHLGDTRQGFGPDTPAIGTGLHPERRRHGLEEAVVASLRLLRRLFGGASGGDVAPDFDDLERLARSVATQRPAGFDQAPSTVRRAPGQFAVPAAGFEKILPGAVRRPSLWRSRRPPACPDRERAWRENRRPRPSCRERTSGCRRERSSTPPAGARPVPPSGPETPARPCQACERRARDSRVVAGRDPG